MKEFFLNHICTSPPYTVASCEYQYLVFATVGATILVGGLVMVGIAVLRRQKQI